MTVVVLVYYALDIVRQFKIRRHLPGGANLLRLAAVFTGSRQS